MTWPEGFTLCARCGIDGVPGTYGDMVLCDRCEVIAEAEAQDCHCGQPVHVYEDGFTRGLCEHCSTVRCDTSDFMAEHGSCDGPAPRKEYL